MRQAQYIVATNVASAGDPMLMLGIIALAPVLVALSWYIPVLLLRRAIARPFPSMYLKILRHNIPPYANMPAPLQQQLQRLILQFLYQKKFVGCDGLQITDEIRVTIAAQACLLILNRPPRVFPALSLILVYPSAFVAPRDEFGLGGVVTHASQTLAGESWSDGRVVLAWDHVRRGALSFAEGHNVVIHEFAHQLDSETGTSNGAPALPSRAAYQRWSEILTQEFEALQQAASEYGESVMDYYGATNPAEFFAVATETFFGKPGQLAQCHPRLYEELCRFYRVDPVQWQ
jgi:Mlc titration factor MtfA (ptsG expression regulator)